jgi:hypothetical protein
VVNATKAADNNYKVATSANVTVDLQKADQATLTISAPSQLTYNTQETLTSGGGSGTGAVTFNVVSGACSIVSGNQLKADSGTGTCSVTATKADDGNYNLATSAAATVTLKKATQTINFPQPPSPFTYSPGGSFVLSATGGGSGNPVIFASTTSLVCTVITPTVTVQMIGTCTLTANQDGNSNYYAAPTVSRNVTIEPGTGLVRYIGQLQFVTSGKSATSTQAMLSASVQDPTGIGLVGAKVDFIDKNTGAALATNVAVSPVSGSPGTGTANKIVTLSTGQYGAESYPILVKLTGNYTNESQDVADKLATVVVAKPADINETTGGGTIEALGAAAGTYRSDDGSVATYSIGMRYNKSGSNLQGKITLSIPSLDGVVYIKSTSITSMSIAGDAQKTSIIYTKATVYKVLDDESVVTIEGNVTLRTDVVETTDGALVGFTVISSRNSEMFYSNQWLLTTGGWKTVPQESETGGVDIN